VRGVNSFEAASLFASFVDREEVIVVSFSNGELRKLGRMKTREVR